MYESPKSATIRRRSKWRSAILAVPTFGIVAAASPRAVAAPPETAELRIDRPRDLSVTVALGVGWALSEWQKESLAPRTCRWCDAVPAIDESTRRAWRWSEPERAAHLSDLLDFVVLPVAVIGADALLASRDGRLANVPDDALVIVQAAVAAAALNQAVKFAVGRERPFVHARDADERRASRDPDDNLSFYSGHTSLAFGLVAAAATTASMRRYRDAWTVWPVGLAAAASIGYLRIAADKHWLTDVATGAAVGAASGALLPRMLHAPRAGAEGASASIGPGPVVWIAVPF